MTLFKATLFLPFAVCGLVAAFSGPGQAGEPATLVSALAASAVEPQQPTITIAADLNKNPVSSAKLQFRLQSLPKDVTLKVCAMRFVMAEDIPKGADNGVLLQLFDQAALEPDRTVAAINVPPGTSKDTAIVLRSEALCDALRKPVRREVAGDQPDLARFQLETTIREGKVVVYGAAVFPADAPRLLLTYDRPNALPGDADWSQIRRDAQHSGRSPWKLYDPDGTYPPTQFAAVPVKVPGADGKLRGDLRQSPLLYGGAIFAGLDAENTKYRLIALDRSGRTLSDVTGDEKPTFLAAGSGRLYDVVENRILAFDVSSLSASPTKIATPNETVQEVPTSGADGSLYVVTNVSVHAYSPAGTELWRSKTGQDNVSAVTLDPDGTTAYVLFGGDRPRLVALDSATGDCRWEQTVPAIDRGVNEAMPIPVAAGSDVLVTRAFPFSDTLYVFQDESNPAPASEGELVPPPPDAACRASAAPRGLTTRGATGDHIPSPVAGVSDDAYYIRGGKLCWSRWNPETERPEGKKGAPEELCFALQGCPQEDAKAITLLNSDSSDHLYGLAAAKKQLFFISVKWKSATTFDAACFMQSMEGLGPNLVLGPDGTLYNSNEQKNLLAIVPKTFASTQNLTLSQELLKTNVVTFRAPGSISTAPDLSLPANTDIIVVAGQKITFGPGLKVATGARLRARVGF
jgi:outer membrane protein assembly factor BamB